MECIEFEFASQAARDAFMGTIKGLSCGESPGYYTTSDPTISIGVYCNRVLVYHDTTLLFLFIEPGTVTWYDKRPTAVLEAHFECDCWAILTDLTFDWVTCVTCEEHQ